MINTNFENFDINTINIASISDTNDIRMIALYKKNLNAENLESIENKIQEMDLEYDLWEGEYEIPTSLRVEIETVYDDDIGDYVTREKAYWYGSDLSDLAMFIYITQATEWDENQFAYIEWATGKEFNDPYETQEAYFEWLIISGTYEEYIAKYLKERI